MEKMLRGVGVSHGVAIGEVRHMGTAVLEPSAEQMPGQDTEHVTARARQAVDAVAIEVERIGEGQRYMAHRLGAGAAEAIPLQQREAIPR